MERLKQATITTASRTLSKNNIIYSPHSSFSHESMMRTNGLGNDSKLGRYAKLDQVMIEFVPTFPKKFDLDIKGYFTKGIEYELPEGTYFKVHIGKDGKEIRHTKEFRLFRNNHYENKPDCASVEFVTEEEDNNTVWIDMPEIPDWDKTMILSGLDLHLLNIIPRK